MNAFSVTLEYKGTSEENRRGHTLRVLRFSSMLHCGCKILRCCCCSSLKRKILTASFVIQLHDPDVKNYNCYIVFTTKGVHEVNKNEMAFTAEVYSHISE
jgi:catabolite regulation protein CreA